MNKTIRNIKQKFFSRFFALFVVAVLPVVVFAQNVTIDTGGITVSTGTGIWSIIIKLLLILNYLVVFLIALAVVLFLIGVVKYIVSFDNPESRSGARQIMINGIIAIFVMVSVWGFVQILVNTFDLNEAIPVLPQVPFVGSGGSGIYGSGCIPGTNICGTGSIPIPGLNSGLPKGF